MSQYKDFTYRLFSDLHKFKQVQHTVEVCEEEKIEFKFKKPGFSKLIIFDLDETLIHRIRKEEDFCDVELLDDYLDKVA